MSKKLIPDARSIDFRTDDISRLSDVEKSIALEQARLRVETRSAGGLRAYLVGVESPDRDLQEMKESLSELGALVRSLGDDAAGVAVQKRARITPATYIGSGKAQELHERCRDMKIDYVVFDLELSPTHVRNLEKLIERPVMDRTEIILQIFRKNAKTKEARTQVEIARLEYLLPRLSNAWIAFERQRGGSGGSARVRGAGEAQLELDRRRMRDKIVSLRKDLEKIAVEKVTQRKSRRSEFNVVLVGYTNAGKTTLMNALTDSDLSAQDALFETLDSAVRVLKVPHNPKILLTDTVGFIRHLPHSLIASFQSTLDETAEADLLLHVVDVSHPHYKDHIEVTNEVLREVGAGEVPRIFVFNKLDHLEGEPRLARILARTYPNSICLSAQNPGDIQRLLSHIQNFFEQHMLEAHVQVSYENARMMGLIYAQTRVIGVEWTNDTACFHIRATRDFLSRYFPETLGTVTNEENSGEGPSARDEAALGAPLNPAKAAGRSASDQSSPVPAPLGGTVHDRDEVADPWQSGDFSFQRSNKT